MAITVLTQIDNGYLDGIISKLIKNKLYRNEAQLQFDLAWEIRKDIDTPNLEIRLEEMTATGKNSLTGKRMYLYTDIVVFDKTTTDFVAIELKYKTNAYNNTLQYHGAYDLGCYDFLWDTKRNETLRKGKDTLVMRNKVKKDFQKVNGLGNLVKGFSVIVTNDKDYWDVHLGSKSCAREFFLSDAKALQNCDWQGGKFYQNTWRDMALNFAKTYTCHWSATINNGANFRYMIFEV